MGDWSLVARVGSLYAQSGHSFILGHHLYCLLGDDVLHLSIAVVVALAIADILDHASAVVA